MSTPAVRIGLTYGLIVAAIGAIATALSVILTSSLGDLSAITDSQQLLQKIAGTALLLGVVGFVAFLVDVALYLLAGRSAAKQTGAVASGASAGLIAGFVATVIGAATTIVLNLAGISVAPHTTTAPPADVSVTLAVALSLFGILIGAAIAAGVGALGGLIGRNAYQKAHHPGVPDGR